MKAKAAGMECSYENLTIPPLADNCSHFQRSETGL
jgi:hypothetical protein